VAEREDVLAGALPVAAGPGEPVLQVHNLEVSFPSEAGRVAAVRGLSFDVAPGEVLGIVGESGSGKSVSALATMGLLPPQAKIGGSIRFRGTELIGRSDAELARIRGRRIAMIFQDPLSALTPIFTVGHQVAEALRIHDPGMSRKAAVDRVVELLDLVGIPNARSRASAFPHEFSGGMRQRVVIAMAIANDPDLIIADEPTTALDVTVQAQVLDVLRTAQDLTGAGIIMITHDLGVVAGFADRVMVMYAGRAVEQGTVDALFAHPRMPYTIGLLGSIPRLDATGKAALVPIEGQPPPMNNLPAGCPFQPRCPMRVDRCGEEPPLAPIGALGEDPGPAEHLTACWRSGEIEHDEPDPAEVYGVAAVAPAVASTGRAGLPRVLDVVDLVKHYPVTAGTVFKRRVGTVHAVDGVSFDIREGEALGLVGESGCGKTTTLMEVLGLEAPMGGRIEVLGSDVATLDRKGRVAVRRDMQIVFQDPVASLDPRLPVGDVIGEPLWVHGFNRANIRRRVAELLELVGLRPDHANRYPSEFSGGQRQRIGIARALALEPKLLVLDEPVSALDVSIQAGVINLLDDLRTRLGLAFLFVAHDLSVIRHVADRVAVMYLGKIVEIGDVDAVYRAPLHPYTQALLSAVPIPDPEVERRRERILLRGELPSPADPPAGCRFHTRCQLHAELPEEDKHRCIEIEPIRAPFGADHEAACHFARVREVI
jgi:peptide/nickel transport system ATP-binding protein